MYPRDTTNFSDRAFVSGGARVDEKNFISEPILHIRLVISETLERTEGALEIVAASQNLLIVRILSHFCLTRS